MFKLNINQYLLALAMSTILFTPAFSATLSDDGSSRVSLSELGTQLQVGDIVFIRIPHAPFTKVADTTSSWTNHVGIVAQISGNQIMIAESRFPFSGSTPLKKFVRRSENGRIAVMRLHDPLNDLQIGKLNSAISAREGVFYDTGFNLHSKRQFCSRYVREIVLNSTGIELGEIENFATLLKQNPQADQRFWRTWYFGEIPWQRKTVTPASLLQDSDLHLVFSGNAI